MSAPRDLDRMIQSFLAEGPLELPDPSYDEVRDRMEQTRQRAFIGPWRTSFVTKAMKYGLAAAAVVVIAIIGYQFLGNSNTGGPGPSPSASSAEPSASAAAAGLPVGSSHVLLDGDVKITLTIAAPGWDGEVGGGILAKNDNVDPPDGAGMIVFTGPLNVYGDACRWLTTKTDAPATTVDALVAALAAQTPRDASQPMDITVDGYSGKEITLHVPDDAAYGGGEFTDCNSGYFGSFGSDAEPGPERYAQGPGQIDELWILDVDGVLTVIDTAYYAGTPDAPVDELRGLVETATFEFP